jgi:uncharacterized protein (DUF983 family)
MEASPDGISTFMMVIVGVVVLGAAMFYAMTQRKRRDNKAMAEHGKQPDV